FPLPYAASAQKGLDAAPEWVLAEHGGAFEFNAEDFRRRVRWGQACAAAADAISPSGDHRCDWDPHRVHVPPLVQKARAGAEVKATIVANNPLKSAVKLDAKILGRGLLTAPEVAFDMPAGQTIERNIVVRLADKAPPGRQVFVVRVASSAGIE